MHNSFWLTVWCKHCRNRSRFTKVLAKSLLPRCYGPYIYSRRLQLSFSGEGVYTQEHLAANNILHPAQHGFIKNRSTCTNLLESFNDWTLYLQDKQQVLIVYIDFRKAFDVISHEKLFTRLHAYGIQGELLLWLKQFFTGIVPKLDYLSQILCSCLVV